MSSVGGRRVRGASLGLLLAASGLLAACAEDPETPGPDPRLSAEAVEGRAVFLERSHPHCRLCHTLREAGATGTLGSDLDVRAPSAEKVVQTVTRGIGMMEPQTHLTPQEIAALGTYVSEASRLER